MARVDPRATIASMSKAEKNIRFGIARGLTQIAKEASLRAKADIPRRFDRPTPFTQNAVAITPATRENLVATVFVKHVQAGYLQMQETGGTETPKPGAPIVVPVQQRTNVYGNIPRGALARAKARPDTFAVGKGDRLRPGIYQRVKRGSGSARQAGLKLLVALGRVASYRPRFRFRETVAAEVMTKGPKLLSASIMDALRTMR